jgi:hypothetical protein
MTGGQAAAAGRSEPAVPQPASKLVAIARTRSGRLQHFPLNVTVSLRCFEALQQPSDPLTGASAGKEEQEDGSDQHPNAQGGAPKPPGTEPGQKASDHRRPRFQSSSRA